MASTLVLRGGTVIDGSGAAPLSADVAVRDGRVVAVGHRLAGDQSRDCAGHVVSPGFIDTHSHSDVKVLADPGMACRMGQQGRARALELYDIRATAKAVEKIYERVLYRSWAPELEC